MQDFDPGQKGCFVNLPHFQFVASLYLMLENPHQSGARPQTGLENPSRLTAAVLVGYLERQHNHLGMVHMSVTAD